MRKIRLSRDSEKFLLRIPSKHARQLAVKLQQLREETEPNDSQKLKNYAYMRVDSGEYRIIYEAASDAIYVVLIGKRNDDEIYKKLKRKVS